MDGCFESSSVMMPPVYAEGWLKYKKQPLEAILIKE